MLFNSSVFLFGFLPVCLLGFYVLAKINRQWAKINFDEWLRLVWWQAVDRWR